METKTKLTTEEYFNPRYKVIAPLLPTVEPINVGDIIQLENIYPYSGMSVEFNNAIVSPEFFDKYPHLFKRLEYWEGRTPEQMPEYIRLNKAMVVKVSKHHCTRHDEFQAHDTKFNYKYSEGKPATEKEYIEFLNSKKR